MTQPPNAYGDNDTGRRWIVLIIFILLVGFIAAGIWFWYNQQAVTEDTTTPQIVAQQRPVLEPLPEAEIIDTTPVTDEEAVADGTLKRFDDNRWLESDEFVGFDTGRKRADLRIYILSQDYSWVFGDGDTVEGRAGVAQLEDLFQGGDFQDRFCDADSILAIGTSSFEGPQALNHALARQRARTLVSRLGTVRLSCDDDSPRLLAASLGEHAETSPCPGRARCPEATSSQRRLILVSVSAAEGGVNFSEALWSGLQGFDAEQRSFFRDFRLSDYDEFEILN
ncbi:MAG: hypothetical protein AAF950_08865 [Pseudomonadota bacterium]